MSDIKNEIGSVAKKYIANLQVDINKSQDEIYEQCFIDGATWMAKPYDEVIRELAITHANFSGDLNQRASACEYKCKIMELQIVELKKALNKHEDNSNR